jgi:hypothetical protein
VFSASYYENLAFVGIVVSFLAFWWGDYSVLLIFLPCTAATVYATATRFNDETAGGWLCSALFNVGAAGFLVYKQQDVEFAPVLLGHAVLLSTFAVSARQPQGETTAVDTTSSWRPAARERSIDAYSRSGYGRAGKLLLGLILVAFAIFFDWKARSWSGGTWHDHLLATLGLAVALVALRLIGFGPTKNR